MGCHGYSWVSMGFCGIYEISSFSTVVLHASISGLISVLDQALGRGRRSSSVCETRIQTKVDLDFRRRHFFVRSLGGRPPGLLLWENSSLSSKLSTIQSVRRWSPRLSGFTTKVRAKAFDRIPAEGITLLLILDNALYGQDGGSQSMSPQSINALKYTESKRSRKYRSAFETGLWLKL